MCSKYGDVMQASHQGTANEAGNYSLMSSLDFRAIDEMDPSLAEGHRVMYDREVPFELRTQESSQKPHDVGTLEGVKTKVLVLGEDNNILSLRIELSSESDLFFHYTCNINFNGFRQLQEEQKLMCEFKEFASILLRMLNRCIKEPQSFLAVLILTSDSNAVLEFIQNMEYKFVELLVLPFKESPEYVIRQHISYRYNSLRSRMSLMQARLQDVNALVKIKNPSLLNQLQRASGPPSLTGPHA
eukprot:TRINITY_DN1595_c0_g1_i1.p1 TRINITY_DN1595_c0_g1~~TRINITY_DN1595_c0_g1_i1.p1  ORF type:complete len:243 (+),score=22.18 TRINITY_DN1595_c0_g1_i1:39-767(+)